MVIYCLDTYALWEIHFENPKYSVLLNHPFVITNWTLVEFYRTMLKRYGKQTSMFWYNKLIAYIKDVNMDLLFKAVDYQHENKREDLSLFDCIGYVYSIENNFIFVTGDKAFKHRKSVLFIQK